MFPFKRRGVERVTDREDEATAGSKKAPSSRENAFQPGSVHQGHAPYDEVERAGSQAGAHRSGVDVKVPNLERLLLLVPEGGLDHPTGPVDGSHPRPPAGQHTREASLTATDIEDGPTLQRADRPQEGRHVDEVPRDILPLFLEVLPDVDRAVPCRTRFAGGIFGPGPTGEIPSHGPLSAEA